MNKVKQTIHYSKEVYDDLLKAKENEEYIGIDDDSFGKIAELKVLGNQIEITFIPVNIK